MAPEDPTKQDQILQEQEQAPELEDFITEAIDALGAVEQVTAVTYLRSAKKEKIGEEHLKITDKDGSFFLHIASELSGCGYYDIRFQKTGKEPPYEFEIRLSQGFRKELTMLFKLSQSEVSANAEAEIQNYRRASWKRIKDTAGAFIAQRHFIPFHGEEKPTIPDAEVIPGDGSDDVAYTIVALSRILNAAIVRNVHAVPLDKLLERPDFENLVLDPMDIYRSIHCFFKNLRDRGMSEELHYYFEQLVKRHPVISYIYHMEFSEHSLAFLNLMKELQEKFGYKFNTPFCDLGSGPGHMLWHLLEEPDMIPFGRVALVDNNPDSMKYAKELMSWKSEGLQAGLHDFHFFEGDAGKIHEMAAAEGMQFQTVYSSLVLQWVEDPDAVIKSIYESMSPGGIFVLIVENPPNITATTPISLLQKGTVGFENGRPHDEIIKKCQEAGFIFENYLARDMGMRQFEEIEIYEKKIAKLNKKGWDNLTGAEKEEYMDMTLVLKNYHVAYAIVWRKPEVESEGG